MSITQADGAGAQDCGHVYKGGSGVCDFCGHETKREQTPMPVTLRNVQRTLAALHDDITIVGPTPTRHRREHH